MVGVAFRSIEAKMRVPQRLVFRPAMLKGEAMNDKHGNANIRVAAMSAKGRIALLALATVWAASLALPAEAALRARAGAGAGGFGDSASYEAAEGERGIFASARAFQAEDGNGNAFAEAGVGDLCDAGVDPGCTVSIVGNPAVASAGAEANANGSLRVRAFARNGDTSGGATASLTDTVTFLGSQVINFRIEIENLAGLETGFGELTFSLTTVPDPTNNDDLPVLLAQFYAWNDGAGSGYEVYRRDDGDLNGDAPLVEAGSTVPAAFDFEFDFASLCGLLCQLSGGLPQDTYDFIAILDADASVFSDGSAAVEADRSLYILPRAQVISANGFDYTVTPVPLPAAGWLFGAALAGLAARRRSFRRPVRD